MRMELDLARERHRGQVEEARRERAGRRAAELRKVSRLQARAERQLLRAWQRAERVRSAVESGR
jgi:hypothetical protein